LALKENIIACVCLFLNFQDVEMADGNQTKTSLKPVGRIGKKLKKKFKMAKGNRRNGNSKPSRKRHI